MVRGQESPLSASPALATVKARARKAGLRFWMERVLEECDRVSSGFGPDPVHDLRVALRRCRSIADGFIALDPDPAWKEMKKAGRRLFSRLGCTLTICIAVRCAAAPGLHFTSCGSASSAFATSSKISCRSSMPRGEVTLNECRIC